LTIKNIAAMAAFLNMDDQEELAFCEKVQLNAVIAVTSCELL
jgi:hypothetical protein